MNDVQVLLDLYKEQRDLGIHHEDQRAKVTGLMFTIATILIGVVAFDKNVTIPVSYEISVEEHAVTS